MGVADFGPRRSGAFARRFPGTLDQAAVGDEILDPGEALDVMDVIEQYS